MENSKYLLCPICNKQMMLNHGDYLFTYNAECGNKHIINNMDLDELIFKRKKNKFLRFCQTHNKKNLLHCFHCREDICLICFNSSHKGHKMEYLTSLYLDISEEINIQKLLSKEQQIIKILLSELIDFKNKINSYIDSLKSQIEKEIELRNELLNKVLNKKYTYIDILNLKAILNDKEFLKISEGISCFCESKTFIEKYDCMRIIFNEGIIRGKYLENNNYLDLIRNKNQIILNNNFVVELKSEEETFLNIKKYNRKLNLQSFEYEIISQKNIGYYDICDIILNNYNDIEKDFSFFAKLEEKSSKNIDYFLIKILNIFNNNERKYEIKKLNIKGNLLHLNDNINIVIANKYIYLYDDLFNEIKILLSNNKGEKSYFCEGFKINKNTFTYSYSCEYNKLYVASIFDYGLDEFLIHNCGKICLNYFEKKKLLISHDSYDLYLTTFNYSFPEVIQKIQIDYISVKYICLFAFEKNESIYFEKQLTTFENGSFYNVEYIVQYELVKDELKEVSKYEIKRKKLKEKDINI